MYIMNLIKKDPYVEFERDLMSDPPNTQMLTQKNRFRCGSKPPPILRPANQRPGSEHGGGLMDL